MNISSHKSSNYDGCDERNKVEKQFNEIIAKTPKNSEWTAFTDLFQYQGFWYTARFLEGIILAQEQFIARPNDIILCSSPRTGTTWLKALAFAVMNRDSLDEKTNPLLVALPHECVPYLEVDIFQQRTTPYPKHPLLATHLPYSSLPKSVICSNSKLVYICRDPKDVFVSLWHFIGNVNAKEDEHFPLEKAFDLFCRGISLNGPYWEHVLGYWRASLERPERILFLKYENLKIDTVSHVRKLAEFIGCPFSLEEEEDGHVQKIVELCSFRNLSNLEVNKTGEYPMFASLAVKNHRYFRKGEVGDWKNCISEEMREHLDHITEFKLNGSGFTFQ